MLPYQAPRVNQVVLSLILSQDNDAVTAEATTVPYFYLQ